MISLQSIGYSPAPKSYRSVSGYGQSSSSNTSNQQVGYANQTFSPQNSFFNQFMNTSQNLFAGWGSFGGLQSPSASFGNVGDQSNVFSTQGPGLFGGLQTSDFSNALQLPQFVGVLDTSPFGSQELFAAFDSILARNASAGFSTHPGFNFGATQHPGFNFGATQHPGFNFGATQHPGFNFGATQHPGFNFGGSSSIHPGFNFGGSSSIHPGFNFGNTQSFNPSPFPFF